MKDICPFCEHSEPVADMMVFEAGVHNVRVECQSCPQCHRRYYTTGQVRKLVELLVGSFALKTTSKKAQRQKVTRTDLVATK